MGQIQTFSTAGLTAPKTLESWRQAMAEVYYRLDIKRSSDAPLNGSLVDWQFESLGISNFRADAQRVIRRRQAAKIDRSEDFVFLFPVRQQMQFEQRSRTGLVEPGDVFLVNSADDYIIDVPDGSENITIKIQRDALKDRVKNIDARCARLNIANPHLVPIVSQLGFQLLKMQNCEDTLRLQDAVIEMICLMLELGDERGNLDLVRQPLANVLFDRIRGFMKRHIHDPDLSAELVAKTHRISLRYLQKIFQLNDTTFRRELMEMRLLEAHRLLVVGSRDGLGRVNIGKVAFMCGFSNQAHFSTRYRERFGSAPSECIPPPPARNARGP
jgi:AraC-like DNA-binding protein